MTHRPLDNNCPDTSYPCTGPYAEGSYKTSRSVATLKPVSMSSLSEGTNEEKVSCCTVLLFMLFYMSLKCCSDIDYWFVRFCSAPLTYILSQVVCGRVVCNMAGVALVPFTIAIVDKEGKCCAVTIYNLAQVSAFRHFFHEKSR